MTGPSILIALIGRSSLTSQAVMLASLPLGVERSRLSEIAAWTTNRKRRPSGRSGLLERRRGLSPTRVRRVFVMADRSATRWPSAGHLARRNESLEIRGLPVR